MYVGNKTMLDNVKKYINRKGIQQKLEVKVNNTILKSLEEVMLHFGKEVFTRHKSNFSQQIIENTIPAMINNGITDLKANLITLKSVRRNSLEHYKLIYGDNAEKVFEERTEKSLQTKNNFINRHGEEKGSKLWEEYSKTKSKQNTLDGFTERFGEELGKQKFKEYSDRQSYTNSLQYYIEKYGEDHGEELYYQRYPAYEYSDDYKNYKNAVYRMSQKVYEDNIETINPNNYTRTRMGVEGGWQLDHIKPVIECFREEITIEEASDISNLRMLPWKENLMRNFK